jgi:hypothetical protein
MKLNGLRIKGIADESAPSRVKVFQGKPDIGFDEAEEEEPTQEVGLSTDDVGKGEAAIKAGCSHFLRSSRIAHVRDQNRSARREHQNIPR